VTAQLIDATLAAHIWAECFDRDFVGCFRDSDEVTQRIAAGD